MGFEPGSTSQEDYFTTHAFISFAPRPSHHASFSPSFEYINDFVNNYPRPTAAVDEYGGLYSLVRLVPGQQVLLQYYDEVEVQKGGKRGAAATEEDDTPAWRRITRHTRVDRRMGWDFKIKPKL